MLSFVYSKDVVRVILQALDKPFEGVYNLACQEKVTLQSFYEILTSKEVLGISEPQYVDRKCARTIYPSVECGPIDITKAITDLGFKPTPLVSGITFKVDCF